MIEAGSQTHGNSSRVENKATETSVWQPRSANARVPMAVARTD